MNLRNALVLMFALAAPVAAAQDLTILADPQTRTAREGDTVDLELAISQPESVSFRAFGLPAGLAIDALTGRLTGVVGPLAAGQYTVSLSAVTPQRDERVTFPFVVVEGTLPQIASPGVLLSQSGEEISLQLVGTDADGEALSYNAYGLPRGLVIDRVTGIVSGTLADHELRTTYTVTLTAWDGHATGGTVFSWIVMPGDGD